MADFGNIFGDYYHTDRDGCQLCIKQTSSPVPNVDDDQMRCVSSSPERCCRVLEFSLCKRGCSSYSSTVLAFGFENDRMLFIGTTTLEEFEEENVLF
jgi:hypothetical protein